MSAQRSGDTAQASGTVRDAPSQGAIVGRGGEPPEGQNGARAPSPYEAQQAQIARETLELTRTQIRNGWWQTAILFLTLGAAFWTIRDGRRSINRQLRAYVYQDHLSLHDGSSADPPWPPERVGIPVVVHAIKNYGTTPAYKVVHWSVVDIKRTTEEGLLTVQNPIEFRSAATLGPTNIANRVRPFARHLTPHEISEIETGVSAIYYYGRIEYRDCFGKLRTTNYRLKYIGVWPPVPNAAMSYCDDGNESD